MAAVSLKQMRFFVASVDWGSVSKAASHMNVAQPALSQQIGLLERSLKAELLIRTARGVTPTDAGERFYRHARAILRQVEGAVADLAGGDVVSGQVSVGLPTSVATILALPLLTAIIRDFPGIRPELFESFSGYLHELTARNRLDLAVLFREGDAPGVSVEPVVREDLFFVSRKGAVSGEEITMREASRMPLVLPSRTNTLRSLVDSSFSTLGLALDVIADVDSLPTMRKAAAAGLSSTILPMSALTGCSETAELSTLRLTEPGISRPISLCRAIDPPAGAPALAVAGLMSAEMRRLVKDQLWLGASLVNP